MRNARREPPRIAAIARDLGQRRIERRFHSGVCGLRPRSRKSA